METFDSLGLFPSLVVALKKLGFKHPTPAQEAVIPLALQGKDILVKSRTGSGKTLAYLIPILSKLLLTRSGSSSQVKALIIAPTKELCKQVFQVCNNVLMSLRDSSLCAVNLSVDDSYEIQKSILQESPAIIVSTPSSTARLFREDTNLHTLEYLVIDEADLILQMGYSDDIQQTLSYSPRNCQNFIVSATLDENIENLKSLFLKNVACIKVAEDASEIDRLKQYFLACKDLDEKLLILSVLLKLKLLDGKILVYVDSTDQGYLLKILLSRFSIRSQFLNPEHPVISRNNAIEEFNRGVFNLLICHESDSYSDEAFTRGLDFKRVDLVVIFDPPGSPSLYTHQIGRTARGGLSGTSLLLYSNEEQSLFDLISKDQLAAHNKHIRPFDFDTSKIEGFRYRVFDAIRSVTKASIKEAKILDIKHQIKNSEKIQVALGSNAAKVHTDEFHETENAKKLKSLMKNVPEYLLRTEKDGGQSNLKPLSIPLKPSRRSLKRQSKKLKSSSK